MKNTITMAFFIIGVIIGNFIGLRWYFRQQSINQSKTVDNIIKNNCEDWTIKSKNKPAYKVGIKCYFKSNEQ